jgi:biopolymer transport protein ExbD
MKPNQLDMFVPSFAGLFLVLSLCAVLLRSPTSTGMRIPLLRLRAPHPKEWRDCGDGRPIVISLLQSGTLKINQDSTSWKDLAPRIAKIMEFRAERTVFVVTDSEVSNQQFAMLIDRLAGSTSDLHIALLTRDIRRTLDSDYAAFCQLEWPPSEFQPALPDYPTTHF